MLRIGRESAWVALLVIGLSPGAAAPFECLEYVPPPLFDTSWNPLPSPDNPRSRGAEVFTWGGHQYLLHATGNDLQLFNIDDPSLPSAPVDSDFQVPPYGDRNYNLFNFSVCNDCRYGAAGYDVQGLVLWDFGTGAEPVFVDQERWVDSGSIGGFTFSYGGQQYLIGRVSPQCQGNALVTFDGIHPGDLGFVQCITDVGGVPNPVDGGFWLDDTVPGDEVVGSVYLLDSSTRDIHMYSVRIRGGHPSLTPEGAVIKAVWIIDHGMDLAIDPPAPWPPFAVSAYNDGLKVWDLSDPVSPVLIATHPLPFMVAANSVELVYPYLYVGTMGTVDLGSGHFYNLSTHGLDEVDPDFWDPIQPWNAYPYMSNKGGAFSRDGKWLFLSRYSVLERFHVLCVFGDGFEGGGTEAWTVTVP